MSSSYTVSLYHCVFSTKERRPYLQNAETRERLFDYMGGIARKNGITSLAINGVEDHMHLLLQLPSTMAIAKCMQLLKTNSSKWIHDTFPRELYAFSWQEGYGAFTIGMSQVPRTVQYIESQQERHRKLSFAQEYRSFLVKHGIQWLPDEALG
jgi:REP element-mobilizing transposase RayT